MSILIKRTLTYHWTKALVVILMLIFGAWQFFEVIQNFTTQWYWLVIATLYTVTINDTFNHRICQHGMIKPNVNALAYKILTYLASLDQCFGPVRTGAIWHISHHKYSDQSTRDNLNFKIYFYGIAGGLPFDFLGPKLEIPDIQKLVNQSYKLRKEIINDPWTQFCEKHDLKLTVVTLLILYFTLPLFLFKILFLGRFIMMLALIGTGICHIPNVPLTYRNFNTSDTSYNNLILHYLFLGIFCGMLQNNHHGRPNSLNTGVRWWEIDTSIPIVYFLKFLIGKKL